MEETLAYGTKKLNKRVPGTRFIQTVTTFNFYNDTLPLRFYNILDFIKLITRLKNQQTCFVDCTHTNI